MFVYLQAYEPAAATVSRLCPLQAGTGFQQRAVHSEVFVARRVFFSRPVKDFAQELPGYIAFQQVSARFPAAG